MGGSSSEERAKAKLLRVTGQILTSKPLTNQTLEVGFPEVPTRLSFDWKEIGEPSGRFVIQDEIVVPGPDPTYYSLTILNDVGEPIAEKRRVPYDASASADRVVELEVRDL